MAPSLDSSSSDGGPPAPFEIFCFVAVVVAVVAVVAGKVFHVPHTCGD